MGHNELWKPLKGDASVIKKQKKVRVKDVKKAKVREKRRKQTEDKKSAREYCLKHLGLNKYTTDMAITYAISMKYEIEMPSSKDVNKFLIKFWESKNGEYPHRNKKYQTSEEFYKSKKWRELRYIALSNSEGSCNLCGASAKDGVQLHVDHIEPRSIKPKLQYELDNLQVLCMDCNLGKSNFDSKDWR